MVPPAVVTSGNEVGVSHLDDAREGALEDARDDGREGVLEARETFQLLNEALLDCK
jgi:hypothetical protein